WEGLVKAAGRKDLLNDARFATRRGRAEHHYEIVDILQQEFCKKPREDWLRSLEAMGVPSAPINTIEESFGDPQIQHLGFPKQMYHPKMGSTKLIGSPVNLSDTPVQLHRAAPLLGEHTEEVLERFGYDKEAVKGLRARGVI
ncbi:MAG TPA: CoA transferase, partial [Nitrospira sp.]|nr:CoA transferase [Nitrospira sp.]